MSDCSYISKEILLKIFASHQHPEFVAGISEEFTALKLQLLYLVPQCFRDGFFSALVRDDDFRNKF